MLSTFKKFVKAVKDYFYKDKTHAKYNIEISKCKLTKAFVIIIPELELSYYIRKNMTSHRFEKADKQGNVYAHISSVIHVPYKEMIHYEKIRLEQSLVTLLTAKDEMSNILGTQIFLTKVHPYIKD